MADVAREQNSDDDLTHANGRGHSRGVSTVVGYVINLAVALLLVTALLTAAGTFVNDQRQRATVEELHVVGERFVAGLATAHRLRKTGDSGGVSLNLPDTVAGDEYTITIEPTHSPPRVTLTVARSDVTVYTRYPDAYGDVQSETIRGGDLRIRFDSDNNKLVVERA